MRAIALALGASLTWGLADFFGPLQGRVVGALRALVYVQLGGLVGIALIVAVRGKGPADSVALLAIPAAISGTLGQVLGRDVHGGLPVQALEPGRVGAVERLRIRTTHHPQVERVVGGADRGSVEGRRGNPRNECS